jgi:pimeloyl-ACP methyl ester carboxylesterase
VEVQETRYARRGDVHIAYRVAGEGPLDLVFVPGWISHVEVMWEEPAAARFLERLASFSRLVLIDKRGTGMSDPVPLNELPSLEERMDDVRAVLDAVGSERAALLGVSEGGPMAMLFAATHPHRTHALALFGSFARLAWAPDYPDGVPVEQFEGFLALVEPRWGTGVAQTALAPSHAGDTRFRRSWARLQRMSASPGAALGLLRMAYETDCRSVLPAIRVPTLVLHRRGDQFIVADNGRFLAHHIPNAKYVELPGADHLYFAGDVDPLLDEIGEFLTGAPLGGQAERVLATVLFVDIVGSTGKAATLGDARWRDLLAAFYAATRREVGRFRGREVDTAGDGLLAAFDGPARAIRCALAVRDGVRPLGLEVRAGLHTGECDVLGDKLSGIAVHTGARVAGQATAGEVLVSSTVRDLVAGAGIRFEERGTHTLEGVPGAWRLLAVAGV